MIPSLENLDWRGFLARPRLPSPPPEVLDALRQEPMLITGAGGSIGSALALRLAALVPPELLLLEASESELYALSKRWTAAGAACPMTFRSWAAWPTSALLEEIFTAHAPRIVFHAAAFKHVPLMEEQPLAAIANNIFGTETLSRSPAAHGARVVLLSTDKAVEPASVMGATKRVAEQIVLIRRHGSAPGQRAGLARQRGRDLCAPDRAGRAGDGDRSGGAALLPHARRSGQCC